MIELTDAIINYNTLLSFPDYTNSQKYVSGASAHSLTP